MDNLIGAVLAAMIFIAFVCGLAQSIGVIPVAIVAAAVVVAMLVDLVQSVKADLAKKKARRKDG